MATAADAAGRTMKTAAVGTSATYVNLHPMRTCRRSVIAPPSSRRISLELPLNHPTVFPRNCRQARRDAHPGQASSGPAAIRQAVPMDGYLAHAADRDQGHGIRGGVRVGR